MNNHAVSDQTADAVKMMVEKDHVTSQALLTLLKHETLSIRSRDYDTLKTLLLSKAKLLDQLRRHADLRKEWLVSLYKVADEQHWHTLVESFDEPTIAQQWHEVNNTINECKAINEVNGVLVNRGQKVSRQLLHILKGNQPSNELYNAQGSTKATRAYSTVAKA